MSTPSIRTISFLFPIAAVLILAFTACGNDDDDGQTPEIRSESGIGVALVAANADLARSGTADDGDQDGGDAAPGAPTRGDDGTYDIDFAPLQQATADGMTVSGYGVASVEADMAVVEFYFGSYGAVPGREDSGSGTSADTPYTAGVITEADIQPVIDALVNVGIDRQDIEFLGTSYYYDAYWSSATLRVTVRDLAILGDAVGAATDASLTLGEISLQSTYVSYMVEDCGPLEEAALSAAVEDASVRADAFAVALGVAKGALTGAQTYSYSAYGGSACDVSNIGPYPVADVAYSEERAGDVALYANVTLTYAIQ